MTEADTIVLRRGIVYGLGLCALSALTTTNLLLLTYWPTYNLVLGGGAVLGAICLVASSGGAGPPPLPTSIRKRVPPGCREQFLFFLGAALLVWAVPAGLIYQSFEPGRYREAVELGVLCAALAVVFFELAQHREDYRTPAKILNLLGATVAFPLVFVEFMFRAMS